MQEISDYQLTLVSHDGLLCRLALTEILAERDGEGPLL